MKSTRSLAGALTLVSFWPLSVGAAGAAGASEPGIGASGLDILVSSGVTVLNENDTALPDDLTDVPIAIAGTYHINRICAVEGEVSWSLPVHREIELDATHSADRKTSHILTYQANIVATLPLAGLRWSPYVTAGGRALTFLSDTVEDRRSRLENPQTVFAVHSGAGTTCRLSRRWLVKADFREFAAFPGDDAEDLSTKGIAAPPGWNASPQATRSASSWACQGSRLSGSGNARRRGSSSRLGKEHSHAQSGSPIVLRHEN